MLKVRVDRRRWSRGVGGADSFLRRSDGKQCCLGFACMAAGLKRSDIESVDMPCNVTHRSLPRSLEGLLDGMLEDSDIAQRLAYENDSKLIDDKEREGRIKRLGREAGLDFEFVN